MAITKGPALSLAARGSIARTMIFSTWKGRPTVKFSAKVTNPKTAGQVGRRAMMRFLATGFGALSPADVATWAPLALQAQTSAYNAWLSYNMDRWNRFLWPTQAYPATDVDGSGEISSVGTIPRNRTIQIRLDISEMNHNWGYHLHRSKSTGFDPSPDNTIRIGFWDWHQNDTIYWVDGPLDPGTYYYRANTFSESGYAEDLFVPEFSGTLT